MSQFSVLGQCCRYDENHGKWRKRAVTACLSCVFNHKIVSKHFFCPMNNHRQRFWQKTTWATIMSQDDKTCIIACLLLSRHNNWRKNIFGHERRKKVKKENIYDIIKRILTYHRYVKKLFRFECIVIWRYWNTLKYPILVHIEQ